jgi:hypothetical protein
MDKLYVGILRARVCVRVLSVCVRVGGVRWCACACVCVLKMKVNLEIGRLMCCDRMLDMSEHSHGK